MIKSYPKQKRIRLKGAAYLSLQRMVLARDGFTCLQCGCYTEAPPHHWPKISQGGQDRMDDMYTICYNCHDKYPNWAPNIPKPDPNKCPGCDNESPGNDRNVPPNPYYCEECTAKDVGDEI